MYPLYVVAVLSAELIVIGGWALGLYWRMAKRVGDARRQANADMPAEIPRRASKWEGFGLIELSPDEQRAMDGIEKEYLKAGRHKLPSTQCCRLDWHLQAWWRRLPRVSIIVLSPPLFSLLAYGYVWDSHRPSYDFPGLPFPDSLQARTLVIGGVIGLVLALVWLLAIYLNRRSIRTPPRQESWRKWLGRQLREWAEMKNRYATKWPDWRWLG